MPSQAPGDADDGAGDELDASAAEVFRRPPAPDDRLWRHPSEVAAAAAAARPPARGNPSPWGVAAASGLIGATLSLGAAAAIGAFEREVVTPRPVQPPAAVAPDGAGSDDDEAVVAAAARTAPAVAGLRTPDERWGSAVAYRGDGYFLTTAAMVDEHETVELVLADGSVHEAEVVGTDATTDLAVVRVPADVADRLEPAVLAEDELEVGATAIALSAPRSHEHTPWVTTGVVSALGRKVVPEGRTALHDVVLVDAPVVPGSAGGALLDRTGSVVGITNGVQAEHSDLAVATPIGLARDVADDLVDDGKAHHVWLGIEGADVTPARAEELDLAGGAEVRAVVAGGPAAVAGLVDGDVVVRVASRDVMSMSGLIACLRDHEPGQKVAVHVLRGHERMAVEVVLGERPV